METGSFTSKVIAKAISDYIESKSAPEGIMYNSFFVVAIRKLMLIYDELDIIMPYNAGNEEIFDINLGKYGYSKEDIKAFKEALDRYSIKETNEDFILIEKMLIDMFMKKKVALDLSENEISSFKDLVASPYANNPLIISYNFLMANNPLEVINYFDSALSTNVRPVEVKKKELLNMGAYDILKYSMDDINKMDADALEKVNERVYAHFNINANAINKNYLLDKAVYDYMHPKQSYSTGNGYVDVLFFMAIIATITMIIIVLTVIFV